jgi:aryl-alcohol dehydrogenase-like predicted oxidoreductase
MDKRKLGRSGIEVGPVGLGGWAIGGPSWDVEGDSRSPFGWGSVDDEESVRAIHRALELGANLFDTAPPYGAGHSERVLGRALKGRRSEAVIVTKFSALINEETREFYRDRDIPMTLEGIRESCEASLRRLDTDYIDVFLFHNGEYDIERAGEVRDILETLVQEGKIRWYGWSTDDPARARVFAPGEHCTAIEFRVNAFYDAPEMLAVCQEYNLAALGKSPLNSGTLTGKFRPGYTFAEDDGRHGIDFSQEQYTRRLAQVEQLRDIFTRDGRSMPQGALAWILTRSPLTVPIPGFKTVRQVEENVGALDYGLLTSSQMRQVEAVMGRTPPKEA